MVTEMALAKLCSVADAVKLFREAALLKAQSIKAIDDHRCHRQMTAAFRYLQSRGAEGRSAFDNLLDDESPEIAAWVAAQLLSEGRTEAVTVLRSHQEMGGLFGFSAEMVLREFEAGRLGSPFGEGPA